MQFFTTLIILASAVVNAMPAVNERDTTTSGAVYTYVVPSEYLIAHPDAPMSIEFDQAQFDQFAAMYPTEVTNDNKVVVTGDLIPQHMEMGLSFNDMSDLSIWKKAKCFLCKAGCPLLDPVSPLISTACSQCPFLVVTKRMAKANRCVAALCVKKWC
jgi:hypothetical protein